MITMRFYTNLFLYVIFVFRPFFCYEDIILPFFVYAVKIAYTVLLAYLKNFAVSVIEAQTKRVPTITLFLYSRRSGIGASLRENDKLMQHLMTAVSRLLSPFL